MPLGSSQLTESEGSRLKVPLLPTLLTAGNLFCGFLALTKIVEADISSVHFSTLIRQALFFILLAFIFDFLDGRVARWGGTESPFGREFDSLADIISFGVAPAFLVHRIVLRDVFIIYPEIWRRVGWFIASIYLICGALRLARFNCLAASPDARQRKEFLGFPIPAAAGLVASLTLFILWWEDLGLVTGKWRYALPIMMLILSFMMVSDVKYPSFKQLDLRTTRPFIKVVLAILFIGFILILREKVLPLILPLIFTAYLIYGFIRPRISRRIRREIEEEEEEQEPDQGSPEVPHEA